jgi:hypothetical protein
MTEERRTHGSDEKCTQRTLKAKLEVSIKVELNGTGRDSVRLPIVGRLYFQAICTTREIS